MVTFSREKFEVQEQIAQRAAKMAAKAGVPYTVTDALMDIGATHATCPLRLEEFRDADDFNFSHDVFGIRRHLNRQTGRLENCFLPRFAA